MEALVLQGMINSGELVNEVGDVKLVNIVELVKQLFIKYTHQETVLAQFEILWAKVEANNWPKVPDFIEKYVKHVLHDSIVSVIKQYVPV